MSRSDVRLQVAPYDYAAAERLRAALGVSHVAAQVLVRRGLADPAAARTFVDADVRHPLDAFGGLRDGAARILAHIARGSRITVHGDYDVDGVSATAVLVRALRTLGADVDWYLPSRIDDGYGLALATVERLAARGTALLVTVDCAITAVEEVAAARAAGVDVVVTDHHCPRADGRLPDAPIVHPGVGGYPCPELCAAGVAHMLARALLDDAGLDPDQADADLDLVALATVADCVPLVGENRRLVRAGLRALASTRKPGLQALMQVARVDPSGIDAGAIGFRLAPRINAAGRLHRADAGLELLLTADVARARAVAAELDAVNVERRDVETRILFEAEKLVAGTPGGAPAYVLAAEGWHPGVIGIVASRIAERHHRPAVLIALDGEQGTGSGRSIPAFDLLGGLQAASAELLRHGGHRAAAGLTIESGRVDAFREAFVRARRGDADRGRPRAGAADRRGRSRRRAAHRPGRGARAPRAVRNGQPAARTARARRAARRSAADGRRAPRLVHARRRGRALALRLVRARQLAAGRARRARRRGGPARDQPLQRGRSSRGSCCVTLNRCARCRSRLWASSASRTPWAPSWSATSPHGRPRTSRRSRTTCAGTMTASAGPAARLVRDVRGGGIAGLLGDLVHSGAAVLAVTAHAGHRAAVLRDRVGGFAVTTWSALEADASIAAGYSHVVAVDPPAHAYLHALAQHLPGDGWIHLAWGEAELELARRVLAWELDLRVPLADAYRALRAASAGGAAARRPAAARPAGAAAGRSSTAHGCDAHRGPSRHGQATAQRGARRAAAAGARRARTRRARGRPDQPSAYRPRRRAPSWSARRRSWPTSAACATGSRTSISPRQPTRPSRPSQPRPDAVGRGALSYALNERSHG